MQCSQCPLLSQGSPLVNPNPLKPFQDIGTSESLRRQCTCLNYPAIVHQQQGIGLLQKLCPVSAKDPGLMFENSKNAFPHNMAGYICINSSQGIIKEVKFFLLGGGQKKKGCSCWPCWQCCREKSKGSTFRLAQCALKTCYQNCTAQCFQPCYI